MKKIVALSLALVAVLGSFAGCGVEYGAEEREDISYLYVNARTGGFGDGYLKAVEQIMEERYKDTSFAEGKTGVDVVVALEDTVDNNAYINYIGNTSYNIHVINGLSYLDYVSFNHLYDITDWVKEDLADGTGSIESKLYDEQKQALTILEGRYYSLPTFACFNGVTYDAQLFENYGFYFSDSAELCFKPFTNSSYTGEAYTGKGFVLEGATKSCGPDGQYNTYDDGLPSSYEEFFYLLDYMVERSITPMVWTGNSMHYTNFLFQALLMGNSSKTDLSSMFSFDSKGEKIKIVDSFDANVPVVSEKVITTENGYELSQQYTRYQALKFLEHFFNNSNYYDSRSAGAQLSNTAAQKVFEESSLDPKSTPIAMLLEGGYWYNEAQPELAQSVTNYGEEKAGNRKFAYMPMPSIEYGTVSENEGRSLTLVDGAKFGLVVNKNISGNSEKEKLAKAFVQIFYEDATLQKMTTTTGIPMEVKYDLKQSQYDELDYYQQGVWDMYKNSVKNNMYVSPMSSNLVFLKNENKFLWKTTTQFFNSVIDGMTRSYPCVAFWQYNATAKSYFEGMKITKDGWKKYLQ